MSNLNKITLLNVDDYKDWSLQVKTELKRQRLWDIVEGTVEPPEAEYDDPAFMSWSRKNDEALGVIKHDCRNEFYDAIRRISSAKIVWDTLADVCALPKSYIAGLEFLAYLDWSLKVKAILTDRQLWDIVEGTNEPPKAENDKAAFKAWPVKNDIALGLIEYSLFWSESIPSKLRAELRSITSARIVWNALAAICALPKTVSEPLDSIPAVIERLISNPAVIERLDDVDNYKDWSDQVKTYLMGQRLWDIVEGTNEPPKAENDEAAFKAWSEANALALGVIVFSCGYRLRFAIWWITSAKNAWDTLEEICKLPKSSYRVPGEYDYEDWSVRMEDYLKACNLWDVVEAATEPPKPKDDEIEFNAWSKKNAIALYLIWESSDAFLSLKRSTKTAQIAWDTLAEFGNPGGIKNSELRKYTSFRQNLRNGNWPAANQFITSCPEATSAIITNTGSTALHIAILAGHLHIVTHLVNMLPTDELKKKDKDGNTVLGYCALVGNIEMAKCIVEKCPILLGIANGPHGLIPVVMALMHNSKTKAMAQYLFSKTDLQNLAPGKSVNGATFVTRCIYSKAFAMALCALEKFPNLVTALDIENESPVLALASMSFAYTSGNQLRFWTRWIYNCICIKLAHETNQIPISTQRSEMEICCQARNIGSARGSVWNLLKFLGIDQIYELKLLHDQSKKLLLRMCEVLAGLNFQQLEKGKVIKAMIKAVKQGRVGFITEIQNACPNLLWYAENSTDRDLFMFAVLHRQDEVFRRLCRSPAKGIFFATVDSDKNTILHIAAMFEHSARRNTVPGAAFLMQREVQWYKEVESIVHPNMLECTNTSGQRPRELFTESHKGLVKEGEKWMKNTASSCTVVAALIVTIMFAASITVPGSNKQDSGLPTFLNEKVFMVFIISDALSLLSASTSLLMFLCILTSRYIEEDFLRSLPEKMIVGLSTLILSIATMMINFCASLSLILPGKLWVVIPVICLASVPVTLFTLMQFHLLIDMVISTYAPRILDKKAKYGS